MNPDSYTPDFDEGMELQSSQEEAYVIHTIRDTNSIIAEIGVDIVMRNLDDYAAPPTSGAPFNFWLIRRPMP